MATEVRSRNSDALQCFESSSPLVIGGKFATSTPISVVTQQPIVAKTRDSANKGTNISTSEKRNTPPSRHNAATSVEPLAQPSTPKQQAPDSATETKTTMINETGKENKEGKKITKSNTILPKIAKTKEDESISVLCSLRMAANCSRFQPQVRQERAAQETLIQLVDEVPAAGKKKQIMVLETVQSNNSCQPDNQTNAVDHLSGPTHEKRRQGRKKKAQKPPKEQERKRGQKDCTKSELVRKTRLETGQDGSPKRAEPKADHNGSSGRAGPDNCGGLTVTSDCLNSTHSKPTTASSSTASATIAFGTTANDTGTVSSPVIIPAAMFSPIKPAGITVTGTSSSGHSKITSTAEVKSAGITHTVPRKRMATKRQDHTRRNSGIGLLNLLPSNPSERHIVRLFRKLKSKCSKGSDPLGLFFFKG